MLPGYSDVNSHLFHSCKGEQIFQMVRLLGEILRGFIQFFHFDTHLHSSGTEALQTLLHRDLSTKLETQYPVFLEGETLKKKPHEAGEGNMDEHIISPFFHIG